MLQVLSYTLTFDRWLFSQNIIRTAERQTYENSVHIAKYIKTEERLIERTKNEFQKEINNGRVIIDTTEVPKNSFDLFIDAVSRAIDKNPDIGLIVKFSDTDWYSKEYIQKLAELFEQTPFDYTSQDSDSFVINEFVGYKNVEETNEGSFPQTMAISRKAFDYLKTYHGKTQCEADECSMIYELLRKNPDMKIFTRKNDRLHIMLKLG